MKTYTLVNLLDIHNEGSLIAVDKLKPHKVIYIKNNDIIDLYDEVEDYYKEKYPNIILESIDIDEGDINSIYSLLKDLDRESTIINITGGKRINSLILLNTALNMNLKTIYVDVLKKQWYDFGEKVLKSNGEFMDIDLENMLNISGAHLVIDSSKLSQKKDILKLTQQIYSNLDLWYKHKKKLHDNNAFVHDINNSKQIYVNKEFLDSNEMELLIKCLKYMKKNGLLNYMVTDDKIKIIFFKDYIKAFIFKSGTWLEVLTDVVVREITEIDDVKSGVVFLWKDGGNRIRNELDVMAVKDSVLICISCKDSEKYDEVALNELDVYSKRLGGETAKKILVATKPPCKKCVIDRAKAMDINLVILDNDIVKFKKTIQKIINS